MANFIADTAYNPGFSSDMEGLGYESAVDATPRWYGVSSGNGNDGVSHLYPDYFVRTCEPWALARAAMLGHFNDKFVAAANDAMEIDGEAEYTISATIYNPEDVDPSEAPDPIYLNSYRCPECNHFWQIECSEQDQDMPCPACGDGVGDCEDSEEQERDGDDTYSAANGAWIIVEVFPVDGADMERSHAWRCDSLDEVSRADVVKLARESD